MLALCARAGEPDSRDLRELAAGIAFHAAERPSPPAGRSDLPRLAARALGSLGRPDTARRVLLFGSGMVRPDSWLVTGSGNAWALDLRQLVRQNGDRLELALFLGLDLSLGALAPLWDSCSGRGHLLLRHAGATARLLLGPAAGPARAAALRHETRRACECRLDTLAAARGWAERPQVLFADPDPP